MCGRFVVARVGSELVSELSVDLIGDDLPQPSFNVAPTAQAAIVLDSAKTEPPTRRLESARWGLVPGWAKDISVGARAFNARSETVAEWNQADDGKVPLFIHPEGGEPMLFAGLYEWWRDPEGAWVLSFTILTRDAVGDLGSIHHRMPVFLDADHADAWLDTDAEAPHDVLRAALDDAPRVAESCAWHEVGRAVGNVRNNSPDLIDPV